MRTISKAEQRTMPWKNGGGSTLQIFAEPAVGRFSWRVSLASIDADGPFSIFDNYERHIMVLSGAGMDLVFEGGIDAHLRLLTPFSFSGDMPATATLCDGPTTDFNLMVDRDYGSGVLLALTTAGPQTYLCGANHCLIYHLSGPREGQGVLLDREEKYDIAASTRLAICEVTRR